MFNETYSVQSSPNLPVLALCLVLFIYVHIYRDIKCMHIKKYELCIDKKDTIKIKALGKSSIFDIANFCIVINFFFFLQDESSSRYLVFVRHKILFYTFCICCIAFFWGKLYLLVSYIQSVITSAVCLYNKNLQKENYHYMNKINLVCFHDHM